MGEGRSFLGEVAMDVRLMGVPIPGNGALVWAGDRVALGSFSPRMRRPSFTGLHCTEAEFIVEVVEVGD